MTRKSKTMRKTTRFCFSENSLTYERSQERLVKSLSHEIEHEEEENTAQQNEVDESIDQFIQQHNWTLNITQHSTRITMEKTLGNLKVKVVSNVKPYMPEEDDQQNEENEEGEEEEDPNKNDQYTEFMVLVEKSGKSETLVFDVLSYDGEIIINSFFVTSNGETLLANRSQLGQDEKYLGPMFDSLDEKLQTSSINFLKSVGINTELGSFLEKATVDLEQRYYMNWLHEIKDFLE